VKRPQSSTTDTQLLEKIRILEEENTSLKSIISNPETLDAKRNIILRSRISILERQVDSTSATLKQFENQAGVVGEIRDLCRVLLSAGIEESAKKQVRKLVGRLAQAELRERHVEETRDVTVSVDAVLEPKLHELFELICRLENHLASPCVCLKTV
jgi:DNA-directed RNA polymerase beta' subunit